jgi:hypothetical protein
MGSEITVRPLEENELERWSRLVAEAPSGSVYSLPAYLRILCDVTCAHFRIFGAFKGTELQGGMAVYEASSKIGVVASNRLLLYYHSPVLREFPSQYPSERTSRQLPIMAGLIDELDRQSYAHLLLHVRHPLTDMRPFLAKGWRVKPNYSYVVPIEDLKVAYGKIEQNLRRLIERADKNGLTFTDDDDFDSFYHLHEDTHRRKGAPLYLPKESFRRYFTALKAANLGRLFHARLADGKVAASQLVLTGPHPVTHSVCAAADANSLSLGSTPFLRWKAFETLSQLGYKGNDLTDAALNDVTRFKSQFGGELVNNWVIVKPESRKYLWYLRGAALASKGRALLKRKS